MKSFESSVDPDEWEKAISACHDIPLQPGEASWQSWKCDHGPRRAERPDYSPPVMPNALLAQLAEVTPVDNRGDIR